MTEAAAENAARPRPATVAIAATLLAVTVAFALLCSVGAQQAADKQRVLGILDPLVNLIRGLGQILIDDDNRNASVPGVVATVLMCAVLVGAFYARRMRAWPLLLLAASLSLAAWAQIELVRMHGQSGASLYALAAAAAVLFGVVCPAPSLAQPTAVQSRGAGASSVSPTVHPFSRVDAVCMGALSIVALLFRLYALPELPNLFNGEMIAPMVASRTWDGLLWYLPDGMLTNSTGIMHLLPQMLFYKLYGVSVYSLRLAAVLYGVLAVPLFYWLAQRLAGTVAALFGTVLLLTAPEQLFWSRLESTNFAPVPVLALISAHLGLSMVERLSFSSLALAALWMPFGRYFYTAGSALVFYPWLQYAHAAVFVRRAWRKAWYAIPTLAAGTFLWVAAISIVLWLISDRPLTLNNPAQHGELILRGAGEYSGLSMTQLIALQAKSSWNNLVVIVQGIFYRGVLSEWYQRDIMVGSVTLMIPATVALVAVSLAYLLGQLQRPRAFGIVLWVGLGLLPAVLSMQPTDRRILLIFPALYLAVGLAAQGFIEVTAQRGGRVAARLVTVLLGAWTIVAALAGLVSHLRLPIEESAVEDLIDFSKPIFAESDAVFFDTDASWAFVFAFGNAERFLASTPCYRPVRIGEWLRVAVDLPCEYEEESYKALLSAQRLEALRQSYDPRRITFLIDMNMPSRQVVEMLKSLFPNAQIRTSRGKDAPEFVALTFDKADVGRLRSPEVMVGSQVAKREGLRTGILSNTNVTVSAEATDNDAALLRGGMFVRTPGWYQVAVTPPCNGASLTVDGHTVSASANAAATPMLSGVHAFELSVPSLAACATPITIDARPAIRDDTQEAAATTLLAPRAAKVERAAAPEVVAYAGYGAARSLGDSPGALIVDFGVDAHGDVIELLQGGGKLRGRRLSPDGEELAAWDVAIPSYLPIWGIAVSPNGTSYVAAGGPVYVYDRDGKPRATWQTPAIYSAEIAPLADGRLVTPVSQESAIYLLKADGSIERKLRAFAGGPGVFTYPVAVTTDNAGTFAVLQGDNEVLLFRSPVDDFQPEFVGSFHVSYFEPPNPRRATFDGPDRLLLSDPAGATLLAYHRSGRRMLAATQERDPSTRGFKAPLRMAATQDYVYVLDSQRHLWQLPRD